MKILHTADWHIGKIVNDFSMLEEQTYILNQVIEKAKEYEVDALIMAGDLYDRSIPPKEAVLLTNQLFTRLIHELKIPVLAIAGNHDSNERLEFAAELLEMSQLYIEGTAKKNVRKVTLNGVNFYLLPYSDYATIRQYYEDKSIHNLEDAMRVQVEQIKSEWNPEEVNILIAHGYIINQNKESVEASDSERPLSIGAAEYVDAKWLEEFDYVALGHLHKAQKVKNDRIRYSGSPLKYSKSETKHQKGFLIVDVDKKNIEVEKVPLVPKREMTVLRGTFSELMESESEDYVFFELLDTHYVIDAMNQLRRRYPYAMGLEYIQMEKAQTQGTYTEKESIKTQSIPELFSDFYKKYKGRELEERHQKALNESAEKIQKERG